MDTTNALKNKILSDIAANLKTFMQENKITFTPNSNDTEIIFAYLNACSKWISHQKRNVHLSNELRQKIELNENSTQDEKNIQQLVLHFKNLFEQGADINNHLSSLIFSGSKQDTLLNVWNIKHVHLNTTEAHSKNKMKKNRSNWLLFCIVEEKDVYFLDVMEHPETNKFLSYSLLKIVYKNNWISKAGFLPADNYDSGTLNLQPKEDEVLFNLYNEHCMNISFEFEGKLFIPLWGITSIGNKTSETSRFLNLTKHIDALACQYTIDEYVKFDFELCNTMLGSVEFNKGKEIKHEIIKL